MHFSFNTALGRGRLPMKEIDIFYWSQAIEQLVFLLGKSGREIPLEHDFPAPTFQVWFWVLHSVSVHQQPQVDGHTAAPQSEKEPLWYTDSEWTTIYLVRNLCMNVITWLFHQSIYWKCQRLGQELPGHSSDMQCLKRSLWEVCTGKKKQKKKFRGCLNTVFKLKMGGKRTFNFWKN